MSKWRRQALEKLPECRRLIDGAGNPMALWIKLLEECRAAYHTRDLDKISRIFEYAWLCLDATDNEMVTAVALGFYEDLPRDPEIRGDLPNRLDQEQFDAVSDLFRYHLSPDKFAEFRREFMQRRRSLNQARSVAKRKDHRG